VLYPWAPWETGAAHFVNFIGSTMGPIFGIMMVDYYLIRKGKLDVNALYQENGEFRFQNGWHVKALIALAVGACSRRSCRPSPRILPAWWGTYGWFFGVAIGGGVYYLLRMGSK
jgi:NCS1 family nucleobase:cation symporter-1